MLMEISALNASIIRVTNEYMSRGDAQESILSYYLDNYEDEVEQIRAKSDEELNESAETFVEYYLNEVFEDCDQALFIDGPVFENDLILQLPFVESLEDKRAGIAALRIGDLLEAGAKIIEVTHRESGQEVDDSHELLVVTETAGHGELLAVPRYGDIGIYQQTEGAQAFLDNAHAISLFVKSYHSSYGVIKLFAGIYTGSIRDGAPPDQIGEFDSIKAEISQDDLWSSGLYNMSVNHQAVLVFERQKLQGLIGKPDDSVFGLVLGSYCDAEVDAADLFKQSFRQ